MSVTVEVEGHSVIVDVPDNSVTVDLIGAPGPAGPSAVSTDAGNLATLGSDSLILVRTAPVIVLGPSDPVPGGTPAGTVIVRTV